MFIYRYNKFYVPAYSWHQIINPFQEECRIIEIQYGNETSEEDIERVNIYRKDASLDA